MSIPTPGPATSSVPASPRSANESSASVGPQNLSPQPPDRPSGPMMFGRAAGAHVVARWATLAVGALCTAVAWFDAGSAGLVAGVVATVLVIGFFWSGMIPLFVVRRAEVGAAIGLAVLLFTYTLRLALVLLVLRLSQQWGSVDDPSLGLTIIACALTWVTIHAFTAVRRR